MICIKKILAFIIFTSAFVVQSTHTMFPRFKKAFNLACKGANLGITFLPPWKYLAKTYESKEVLEETTKPASEKTTAFVHAQLKAVGIRAHHPVRILPDHAVTSAATDGKKVYVHPKLEALLKNTEENREAASKLNAHKAMIQHEATHIKNNDQHNKEELIAYAPFITHFGAMALKKIAFARKAASACPTIAQSLLNIPAAFAKLGIQSEILLRHSKYIEQRADDGISDDLDILQAAQITFLKYDLSEDQAIKNLFEENNIKLTPKSLAVMKRINTPFHPTHARRAAKFEQRIAKLQQEKVAQANP